MEISTCSGARTLYSWWWDSITTPKNSKWLQDNLTEMDGKIKSMITIIEEDADSFARRAEMYYKKRPELMKLVEEFYRAYRALAERYDRVTGALRQAQLTISMAFPNQIQSVLPDEPPAGLPDSVEEEKESISLPSYYGCNGESSDENSPLKMKEDWKHLNWLITDEESLNLKEDLGKNSEFKELQEEIFKLSAECTDLKNLIASESARAVKAETESQDLKNAIFKLKSQLDAAFLQHEVSLEKMSIIEAELSQKREEARHLVDEMNTKAMKLEFAEKRCFEVEEKNRSLRFDLSKFDEEVSELLLEQHNLQSRVRSESNRAEKVEIELCRLREQYILFQEESVCLKMMAAKLEEDEQRRLKLVGIQENGFLQIELSKLKRRVLEQEEELFVKEKELAKLQRSFEDERQQRWTAEMAIQSLKKLHSESEERSQILELRNLGLEEENKRLCDENNDLNEKISSFSSKFTYLPDELSSLKRPKLKIADGCHNFELLSLEKGRNGFEERHQNLMEQMVEMNFNVASLYAIVQQNQSEKNLTSFIDITEELNLLKMNISKLEERGEYFHGIVAKYTEAGLENVKKMVEKSRFFENSMTDTIFELDGLDGKVAKIESHMKSLEDRFSIFESKHVNTKSESEINDVFTKDDHENRIYVIKNSTNENNQPVIEEHAKVEHHQEKLLFITLLEQLGFSLVELRARINVHEMESEKKNVEILLLGNKNDELVEANKLLIALLDADKQPKEDLFFEKLSKLNLLVNDVFNLHGIANNLGQDMRVICENLRSLQTEKLRIIELEKKVLLFSNKSAGKDAENELLSQEIFRLRKEAEALRRRDMSLESELQKVKHENQGFEEECATYLIDINTASINELVFKQKAVELMINYKNLETANCDQREDLMKNAGVFEKEDCRIKTKSLDNDVVSLKDHILSIKRKQSKNLLARLQRKKSTKLRGKDHSPELSSEIMDNQLQKTMAFTEKYLSKKEAIFSTGLVNKAVKFKAGRSSDSRSGREKRKDANLDVKKSNAAGKDVRSPKTGRNGHQSKIYQSMKSIKLDHVLSSLQIENNFDSEINENAHKVSEQVEGECSKTPPELEKEYSPKELKLQLINGQSYHEWFLNVSEALSSDALRLSALKESSEELRRRIEAGQKSSQSSNRVTEQLKIQEGVIRQLIHMNFKLSLMAENIPASLEGIQARKLIDQRVQRASEKIDGIEMELENSQLIMSKYLKEDKKVAKALVRKSKFPLKDFIYGIKIDSKLLKKRPFCSCMQLHTEVN